MNEKVTQQHLDRCAYVYVRQSSGHQVRHHHQGRQRQYDLAERARELGFRQVEVIDDDQGKTGSGLVERPGFATLLAAVCSGQVGAVFALEASRLARNNRDWHHLIDLCALTDTLIIDGEGVYDSREVNDRLLLGLKGTMSEFELSLMRQRAREAFEMKVAAGHAMWEMPVGFVRDEDDRIEKIADRQVQAAIESVLTKFRELGSARQTVLWFRDNKIPLPEVVGGTRGREVIWRLPSQSRIQRILKNPCYAGALAYGKTEAKITMDDGRARKSSTRNSSRRRSGRCCCWITTTAILRGRSFRRTCRCYKPMRATANRPLQLRPGKVRRCWEDCFAAATADGSCSSATRRTGSSPVICATVVANRVAVRHASHWVECEWIVP
jgi:DNA invertase Pin-like site-specific DNA recombinase